jgi:predicted nucleic acid-binding Zn ribbon protein
MLYIGSMSYKYNILCDRCGEESTTTIMSWFTQEIICSDCKVDERKIQEQLPNRGVEFEGCGFIPDSFFKYFNPKMDKDDISSLFVTDFEIT